MNERLRTDYTWTSRQKQVLALIASGRSNTEIAEELGLSLSGAKWHVSEVMSKLHAEHRQEVADYWRRYNGLAPRFARVFRGLVGVPALKWTAGAAAGTLLAAGGLFALAAAQDGDDGPPSGDASPVAGEDNLERLRAVEWILVDVAGVPAVDGVTATLRFTDPGPQAANVAPQPGTAGWAGGQASCNGFTGGVDISGDRITVHGTVQTLMGCAALRQEERYMNALASAERFAFEGAELVIFAAGYEAPLRFRPGGPIVPDPAVPSTTAAPLR